MRRHGLTAVCACLLGVLLSGMASAASPDDFEFFEKHVRPIFVERCQECHASNVDAPDANLSLDSRAGFLRGGDNGPIFDAADLAKSRLLVAVSYEDVDLQMPPDGKLPSTAIEILREWVRRGAPWPDEPAAEPAKPKSSFDLAARKASHWAWKPLAQTSPSEVRNTAWPRLEADRYILHSLEAAGLAPAREADRATWLRRVTFDLIGLPPTIEEIRAFLTDDSADAHEKVVDRLLASPRFGERWARHWLDLVRYAETKGHEFDYAAPNAYQYRDYVIRAFNADLPYDQFTLEHVAGDLLPTPRKNSEHGFNESIIAPGFWLLGEEIHSPVDTRQDQADRFDNRIDVFSKTFFGLTVACARCHDHKFDAIGAQDYYALFGILESCTPKLARFDTQDADREFAAELAALETAAQPPLKAAFADALRPTVDNLPGYLMGASDNGLDPALCAAWKKHLESAAQDPADPFHLVALRLAGASAEEVAAACGVEEQRTAPVEVVVDYSNVPSQNWLPDEVSFGLAPRQAGEIDFRDGTPRWIEHSAATFDAGWNARTLADGQQLEPGAIAGALRPGRTLCTPNFTVRGKLFCLVRGAGQIYAGVDQHALLYGPLHGRLALQFDTAGAWQWIERDLTEYAGHIAHVEFTPSAKGELAVMAVVQAETSPALPGAASLTWAAGGNVESLVAAYQTRFRDVLSRLADADACDENTRRQDARLLNWALDHPQLFAVEPSSAFAALMAAAKSWQADREALLARVKPESRLCLTLQELTAVDKPVYLRGSPKNHGAVAPRRGPEAIFGDAPLESPGSGRLELARQMVDADRNPLFARVIVNRIWHHLFGRGIVASVDNFGVMGDAPTHPELLDHLARQFARDGWSQKRLIRELVLSSTYRMDSTATADADAADPQNLLLHRMRVRRLEGEAIRDAMLSICGSLDETAYGPSVPIYLNEFMDGRGRPASSGPLDGANRRSIYLEVRRNFLSPLMLVFDAPIPFSTVGRRNISNVPAQSLALMNDPLVHELSARWAKRAEAESKEPNTRIERMYLAAFGRPPTEKETERCATFLQTHGEETGWQSLAHALWNVKEFVFVR